jgi:hypothetical protein
MAGQWTNFCESCSILLLCFVLRSLTFPVLLLCWRFLIACRNENMGSVSHNWTRVFAVVPRQICIQKIRGLIRRQSWTMYFLCISADMPSEFRGNALIRPRWFSSNPCQCSTHSLLQRWFRPISQINNKKSSKWQTFMRMHLQKSY